MDPVLPLHGSTNIGIAGMAGPGLSRCMNPIENWDIPASYVSLPEPNSLL